MKGMGCIRFLSGIPTLQTENSMEGLMLVLHLWSVSDNSREGMGDEMIIPIRSLQLCSD